MDTHGSFLSLVAHENATHIAIKSGSWFDPTTWQNGIVPTNNANVVIEQGVEVLYDRESDTRLRTVRVDGKLAFAQDRNTKIIVDYMAVAEGGTLEVGTEAKAIQSDKQTRIIFAPVDPTNRAIDTHWDPHQFSRGLISEHGATVNIWGAEKTPYLSLAGNHYAEGTQLVFSQSVPTNWKVGNQIVLTGTQWNKNGSHADNSKTQDEVLTIQSINGNTITFNHNDVSGNKLRFNHTAPDGLDLKIYAANLSRNVTFETEGGKNAPIAQRGHTMFHDNVDIHNAGFYALGRTNKDILLNDPQFDSHGHLIPGTGTNVKGRYPIHVHEVFDNNPSDPGAAEVSGNAIWGSPGWGVAIHSSRAIVEDNVSFDVLGAHYVTEDGDEQVAFRRNIAIKAAGAVTVPSTDLLQPNDARGKLKDLGTEGVGYWLDTSYSVTNFEDNIATGTEDSGILIYGKNASIDHPIIAVSSLPSELQSIAGTATTIDSWKVPIHDFLGNSIYNADQGVELRGVTRNDDGKDNFNVGHGQQSVLEDLTVWGVRTSGVQISYSSNIAIKNSLIVGNPDNPILRTSGSLAGPAGVGVYADKNARSIVYDNIHVEGFNVGATIPQTNEQGYNTEAPFNESRLIGGIFRNNIYNLYAASGRVDNGSKAEALSPVSETAPITPYFEIQGQPIFEIPSSDRRPVAQFQTASQGGLAVQFDASASYDPDYVLTWSDSSNHPYTAGNNTIASFAWDFNNDAKTDDFGRYASRVYNQAGSYSVTLKVTDFQGNTASLSKQINVTSQPFLNRIKDSNFSASTTTFNTTSSKTFWYESLSSQGWNVSTKSRWNKDATNGRAYADDEGGSGLTQIVYDQTTTRGLQTIRFDAKNWGTSNTLRLQVYGVNGQFTLSTTNQTAPVNVSTTVPFNSVSLLDTGNLATTQFDWKTFNWNNINFGSGYEFIALRFTTLGVSASEFQAIDNVFLGTQSSASSSPLPTAPSSSLPINLNEDPLTTQPVASSVSQPSAEIATVEDSQNDDPITGVQSNLTPEIDLGDQLFRGVNHRRHQNVTSDVKRDRLELPSINSHEIPLLNSTHQGFAHLGNSQGFNVLGLMAAPLSNDILSSALPEILTPAMV